MQEGLLRDNIFLGFQAKSLTQLGLSRNWPEMKTGFVSERCVSATQKGLWGSVLWFKGE